ncbi:hypothetical protein P3S68_006923 [Capsicum galapagoense]
MMPSTMTVVQLCCCLCLVMVTTTFGRLHPRNLTDNRLIRRNLLGNGLGGTPQMGWSSWNHFACNIHESMIRETADAMVSSGLSSLGYEYINIGNFICS